MIVCHCNGVTDSDIKFLISTGSKSIKDIQDKCGACTHCQGCRQVLAELLNNNDE